MKSRYTHKDLDSALPALNGKLAKLGHEYRFDLGARYGYSAIDLATPEQLKTHTCYRMLAGGTPRECLAACNQYLTALV